MKLDAVLEDVPVLELSGRRDAEVLGVAYHSKAVSQGTLFCTWQGVKSDGHAFVQDAVDRGAAAIVSEKSLGDLPCSRVKVRSGRAALSRIAANFYARPALELKMVGITGTNGKTSTSFLVHHILETLGWKSGLLGTVLYDLGDGVIPAERTTPEGLDIQRHLRHMRDCGCTAAVMETSSHALDQGRVEGIPFSVAVFTNLTQDHLDYHGTMEKYFAAKQQLFLSLKPGQYAVLNHDDSFACRIGENLPSGVKVISFGESQGADLRAEATIFHANGTEFTLDYQNATTRVVTPWVGSFNLSNTLAAIGAALALGFDFEKIVKAVATAPFVPGRLERIAHAGDFLVLIDYAHTDDAIRKAAEAVRPLTKGHLRILVGCGGNRDKAKRPLMARAACEQADEVIFTSDNPRNENPAEILRQMTAGVSGFTHFTVIPDRSEAIHHLIQTARPGDVLLIAGKGHETTQEIAGVKHAFSDREVAKAFLEEVRK